MNVFSMLLDRPYVFILLRLFYLYKKCPLQQVYFSSHKKNLEMTYVFRFINYF